VLPGVGAVAAVAAPGSLVAGGFAVLAAAGWVVVLAVADGVVVLAAAGGAVVLALADGVVARAGVAATVPAVLPETGADTQMPPCATDPGGQV